MGLLCYIRTVPIPYCEASVSNRKGIEKLSITSIGALTMTSLRVGNAVVAHHANETYLSLTTQ